MWPFGRHKNKPLGQRGEDLAAKMLKSSGLKILARNYRCPAVNAHKQHHIKKVADYYLSHHATDGYNTRCDIVSVIIPAGRSAQIEHIPNAF
ncbi:MAG: hypothetical protein QF577_01615 [Phycisphaerae bacterium]|jgi:Holliday junction resolvase-like predicted endonuclease|nr:hypothetical protein [Phycisphaerae bacterium]MDP7636223.1 hypothetical protein [Phycisphaerae bacterium]